jgi:hypothetical protein
MLRDQVPFKAMLSFFRVYGFWDRNSLKRTHKCLALLAYLTLQPLALILMFMNLRQCRDFDNFVRLLTLISTFIMSISFTAALNIHGKKIGELMNEIGEIFQNKPATLDDFTATCESNRKIVRVKVIAMRVWIILGIFGSLNLRVDLIPIWLPLTQDQKERFFYVFWPLQPVIMIYSSELALLIQELLNGLLALISVYLKFFQGELRQLDLTGINGKKNLIECVLNHQKIQR